MSAFLQLSETVRLIVIYREFTFRDGKRDASLSTLQMNECDPVSSELPIRQGDVFRWSDASVRDPWNQVGVIITADCDIAQKKSPEFYSYVPVISLEQYIREIWAEKKLKALAATKVARLKRLVFQFHVESNPFAIELSDDALVGWIRRASASEVASILGAAAGTQQIAELEICHRVARAYFCDDQASHSDYLQRLVDSMARVKGWTVERTVEQLRKDARGELKSLPQDVFSVGELPGLTAVGFVALLRYLRPIAIVKLVTSFADARNEADTAFRLGRLAPVMKYALVQKFATLFTRIGLPTEFEETHDAALELVTGSFIGGI